MMTKNAPAKPSNQLATFLTIAVISFKDVGDGSVKASTGDANNNKISKTIPTIDARLNTTVNLCNLIMCNHQT